MEENFENEPADSVTNRVNFFNKKLSTMKNKQAVTPPRKKKGVSSPQTVDEAAVLEADDIINSFSSNENDDEKASKQEIAFGGFGAMVSDSDKSDEREVLMHSMGNPESDISLEELFSNAAALDVRLETDPNASGQELFTKPSEEEDTELEPLEDQKSQDEKDVAPAALATTAAAVGTVATVSKPRTVLYDSDDEDIESGAKHVATGRFIAMPYSDGKRKQNDDGMSVTSDDISMDPSAGVLKPSDFLPYTVLNANPKEPPPNTARKYKIIITLSCLVLLVLIGILIWLLGYNTETSALAVVPTEAPTAVTTAPIATPIILPETLSPTTLEPTEAPTKTTIHPVVTDFEISATLVGQANGDRLGSVISMSSDGTFMVSLSSNPSDPILTFQRRDVSDEWFPILAVPVENEIITPESSLAFSSGIACATTQQGTRVVAVSSRTGVEVFQLEGALWVGRGQPLPWDVGTVSYSAMALSADASTLAVGFVNEAGDDISVRVYRYDDSDDTWKVLGEDPSLYTPKKRSVGVNKGNALSLSMALSGDGSILAVEQWAVMDIQIVVQNFEFNADYETWEPMGGQLMVPFGPASIALSENGYVIAVVAAHPGQGVVFEWNGDNWYMIGGNEVHGFLPGGSSVALARNGSRIIIGDSGMNKALIYDYGTDKAWLPTASIWGADGSSFGTSVVMDETGTTVGVGAPTSNVGGNNLGQVFIYG